MSDLRFSISLKPPSEHASEPPNPMPLLSHMRQKVVGVTTSLSPVQARGTLTE